MISGQTFLALKIKNNKNVSYFNACALSAVFAKLKKASHPANAPFPPPRNQQTQALQIIFSCQRAVLAKNTPGKPSRILRPKRLFGGKEENKPARRPKASLKTEKK